MHACNTDSVMPSSTVLLGELLGTTVLWSHTGCWVEQEEGAQPVNSRVREALGTEESHELLHSIRNTVS